jgi:TolA-binding protein
MDLNYWLANAYLQTGQYTEAEDVILTNMTFTKDDRFHFLLAMTYESQNKIEAAWEEYLRFIKQFPKSDYKMTALIKARMLGRR